MSLEEPVNRSSRSSSVRSGDSSNSSPHLTKEEISDETPQAFEGNDKESQLNEGDELDRYESDAEASRTLSRRLTGADALIEEANNTDEPLPKMGGKRDYPPPLGDRSIYAVSFDGIDDPTHPHNWRLRRKFLGSFAVGLSALCISMGSAMFAEASADIEEIFHVGSTVATLGTSLFVFGFASGPIIWGPLSELFGRKIVLVLSSFIYVCFCFAVATAKDIQTIMICRFFGGFCGAAPLVAAPAAMADLFNNRTRGVAIAVFAMLLFGGPMLAPIFGGFIVKNSSMGWRWTSYMIGIIASLSLLINIFIFEETHHPLILVRKAEILRRRTGNWGIHAPHEEVSLNLKEIVEKNISRPLVMLSTEPIILLVSLYNAFIYGILYLCLTAIPLIFEVNYGWTQGVAELPYLAMLIGIFIGGFFIILFEKRYIRAMEANGGKPVPEERLPPMMVGGFFFAGGLFWMCWGGSFPDKVHWIVPTLGAGCIGIGLIMVFLPCLNYIVDCYLFFAASALAGNTFIRSIFGAAFPLFALQMFENMHIKWAGTLLGLIGVVLIPVPFLFYKYGLKIRDRSKYAFVL